MTLGINQNEALSFGNIYLTRSPLKAQKYLTIAHNRAIKKNKPFSFKMKSFQDFFVILSGKDSIACKKPLTQDNLPKFINSRVKTGSKIFNLDKTV